MQNTDRTIQYSSLITHCQVNFTSAKQIYHCKIAPERGDVRKDRGVKSSLLEEMSLRDKRVPVFGEKDVDCVDRGVIYLTASDMKLALTRQRGNAPSVFWLCKRQLPQRWSH